MPTVNPGYRTLACAYLFRYTSVIPSHLPILEVRFYATTQHREPAREWLKSLAPETRKIIGEDIKTIQFGWPLGMPLVRKMDAGLWEVRSETKAGTARLLFTMQGPIMVLLHGFIKKSAKTPKDDLQLALRRAKEVHS